MAPKKIKNKAKRVPKKTIKRRAPPAPFATSSAVVNVYQQPFNEPRTRAPFDFFSSGDKGLGKAISTPTPVSAPTPAPTTMASQLKLLKSPISLSSQSQAMKARASLPVNPTRAEIEGVGLTALRTERLPSAPPQRIQQELPLQIFDMGPTTIRSVAQQTRRLNEREARRAITVAQAEREESSEHLAPDY